MEITIKVSHVHSTQKCLFSCRMRVRREVHSKTEGKARRCNNVSKDIKDLKDVLKRSVCLRKQKRQETVDLHVKKKVCVCVFIFNGTVIVS